MKSSFYPSFRQIYQRRPSDNNKVLHRFLSLIWSQLPQTCRSPKRLSRSTRIMSIPPVLLAPTIPPLWLHSLVVGLAFVGTSINIGRTRQSKIPCFELSSELFFKEVLVTQGFLRILSEEEEVYNWASHLISNPSLSSLILTGLQKSPTSFDFCEKDSSLWSRPR